MEFILFNLSSFINVVGVVSFIFVVHGSNASLLSGGSSLYGSTEERQANEVRRLKRELTDARERVMSLSTKLSTNVSTKLIFFFYLDPLKLTEIFPIL